MQNRISSVREILKEEEIDALLISSHINISYLTGFSGFDMYERGGYAFLTRNKLYLFANSLYAQEAKTQAKEAEVIPLTTDQKLIPALQEIINRENLPADKAGIKTVGFEENLTYSEYTVFKKLKNVKLKLTDEIIEEVRVIKDRFELASLKKACKLTDDCYSHILKNMRVNMTEREVAWEMEKYIKENGGDLAFPTIVAFGENSATPHHKVSSQKLVANSCILLDFGAKVDGYCADMTRTVFFGKADVKFKKMYETVRQAQELPLLRLNLTPHSIDKLARDYIMSQGYPSIPHSVGHGVGLEVHELPHISPSFTQALEPNTQFTIEPGVYIPGFGGVRIEDTVFYDGKKIIPLTDSSKNLIELK